MLGRIQVVNSRHVPVRDKEVGGECQKTEALQTRCISSASVQSKANLHILAFTPRLLRGRVAVYFEIYDSKGQFVKGRRSQGFCSYFGNEVALGFIVIPVVFHSLFMFIIWNKVK